MPPLRRTSALVLLLALVMALGSVTPAGAATSFDPALRFRRSQTAHFTIYFHQGEDAVAARLSRIVEETYTSLGSTFGWTLPPHTHVVLVDQSDLSNGYATPLPYNTVVLFGAWPSGHEGLGLSDDWLRLVFTHEFTHIAHLDRSRGWARAVRGVFGRVPLAFPNLTLPTWQIEGIATYFESAVTGQGRELARDFRAIEVEPARAGRRMPLDRVNGGLVQWPGGTSVYSYGLGFHEYLAGQTDSQRLVALADRTAGRLPFFGSTAFKPVFGDRLGTLWSAYQTDLVERSSKLPPFVGPRQLTHETFAVSGVRFLAPLCEGCDQVLAYSVRNPHEFPSLKTIPAGGGPARTVTTRFLGETVGSSRQRILFDQREYARNAGLYSDLYSLDRTAGTVRRLTDGLRIADPDLSPDGRMVVATQQDRDRRRLVLLTLADDGTVGMPQPLRDEPDVQYATPRWSPDGSSVAAERHRRGETSEVVVIAIADGAMRTVARGTTRAVTPAWMPSGRRLIVAVDAADTPFNLVEVSADGDGSSGRQLTTTSGGALWPDVSADGRQLAYVGFTGSGYDVFTQPYPADAPVVALPASARPSAANAAPTAAPADAAVADGSTGERYSPWQTLAPRAWTPLVFSDADQAQVGVSTSGIDVLGYHAYSASAWWRVRAPADVPAADSAVPDWNAAYVYDRWQPQFFASASRATSFFTGASADERGPSTLREQTLEAGVSLPIRRALRSQRVLLSATRSINTLDFATTAETFRRLALRSGWSYRSARSYGYSISAEDGVAVGIGVEAAGGRMGSLADATTVTADGRAYLRGLARHHVVAVRAAAARSDGPRAYGRTFRLGGATSNASPLDFSRSAFSLLRGFGTDAFAGRRLALVNADYRLPLLRIERGHGTWPLFVRQLHGAVFADVGHTWRDELRWRDVKTSYGVELAADVVAGYSLPFTVVAGVARGHDGAGRLRDRTTYFLRVGRAF